MSGAGERVANATSQDFQRGIDKGAFLMFFPSSAPFQVSIDDVYLSVSVLMRMLSYGEVFPVIRSGMFCALVIIFRSLIV